MGLGQLLDVSAPRLPLTLPATSYDVFKRLPLKLLERRRPSRDGVGRPTASCAATSALRAADDLVVERWAIEAAPGAIVTVVAEIHPCIAAILAPLLAKFPTLLAPSCLASLRA
jgi:hypothetical protein